eukprot:5808055-Pleurochrysis_carterae.AAC.1
MGLGVKVSERAGSAPQLHSAPSPTSSTCATAMGATAGESAGDMEAVPDLCLVVDEKAIEYCATLCPEVRAGQALARRKCAVRGDWAKCSCVRITSLYRAHECVVRCELQLLFRFVLWAERSLVDQHTALSMTAVLGAINVSYGASSGHVPRHAWPFSVRALRIAGKQKQHACFALLVPVHCL